MHDSGLRSWLADHAIGGKSGARDLRNLMRREVEDRITTAFIDAEDTQILRIALLRCCRTAIRRCKDVRVDGVINHIGFKRIRIEIPKS